MWWGQAPAADQCGSTYIPDITRSVSDGLRTTSEACQSLPGA